MTSIMKTGNYVWSYEPSILTSSIPEGLNRILVDYLNHRLAQGCRTTTLRGIKPKIKHFLRYVASLGFDDLKGLEISDINSYLPVLADSYGNVGDSLSLLRSFGAYLSENSLCSLNLETIFTIKVPNRKKIHSGFDKDEVTAILNAPDKSTALGKRDYAIIMLAAYTGLRGVDVLTLRFSDIDWRLREIRLIQSKTSKPVMLPVPVAVLNAVAEYILEARPENTATDIIFLRSRPPYDPLKTWSAHSIIKHNAAKAGIAWQADERKGFHTMRRTLASRMLASDVSIDTIKEVLGHSSPDSTKPYISVELSGLKECPLTLESIPLGREELR
ncbi:MAG: site-specific integrase [Bacteroidales bacterium]|nr:site-specific integrase [Bacteroidales bacterium]